jgi:cell volume regulation protein A
VVNRIGLSAPALYPLLVIAIGMLSYGATAVLGGSGFLAVYVTGITLGAGRLVFERGILLFNDAAAWFGQIIMFVVLGLLSFPGRLLDVAPQGLLIALVLMFIARPVAVALTLLPFRFNTREFAFLALIGLKGAVPITLATYPLMYGLPAGSLIFDTVFFVVLVSAATQGIALPVLARKLRVEEPARSLPPATLEITSLHHVDADIVEYTVGAGARVVGRRLRELQLPDGVVVALITRAEQLIPPQGRTILAAGDHLFVVLRPAIRGIVDRVFEDVNASAALMAPVEFPLKPDITVAELGEFYDINVQAAPECTLRELLETQLAERIHVGARVSLGSVSLSVLELSPEGELEQVGLTIEDEA